MKNIWPTIIKIWNYFKPSWEGDDGKASHKKLFVLADSIFLFWFGPRVQTDIHLYVFLTFAALFAIMIGIINWAQLTALLKFTLPLRKLGIQPTTAEVPPSE